MVNCHSVVMENGQKKSSLKRKSMFDDCSNLKKPENKGKLNKLTTSIMKTSTLEVACRSGLSTCDAFNKIREKKKKKKI